MESPTVFKRKLSKLKSIKASRIIIPITGELDLRHRILAITEGIKAMRKKSNSILYNNFDPTFSAEKSLDVIVYIILGSY
jgi:hypothetical protein